MSMWGMGNFPQVVGQEIPKAHRKINAVVVFHGFHSEL